MKASKRRTPQHPAQTLRGTKKADTCNSTTPFREFISMILAALIFAVTMWSSVFGAADDLASGPITPMGYSVAEVTDGR